MKRILRHIFFLCFIRPVILIILGLNVRHRERLPLTGPALLASNHNSHLDTLVLITLFPMKLLSKLRPVAARDYFLRTRSLAWFSLNLIGIIPLDRSGKGVQRDPLEECCHALERGEILIIFPEGSRGEPEQLSSFKTGIAHLAKRYPHIPVVPIFLHGAGKALPRGEAVLVPFFCDVFVGQSLNWTGDKQSFMDSLQGSMKALAAEGQFSPWE